MENQRPSEHMSTEFPLFDKFSNFDIHTIRCDYDDYYDYEMDLWIHSARRVGTIRNMKCIKSYVDYAKTFQLIKWWFKYFHEKDRTEMEKRIEESRDDYKEHGKWLSDIFPRLL